MLAPPACPIAAFPPTLRPLTRAPCRCSDPDGFNQTRVADRMARVAAARQAVGSGPRFVLSTG